MKNRWTRRVAVTGVALALAIVAGGCDWAQYRFDAGRSNNNGLESTLNASNVSGLHVKRTLSLGASTYGSGIVVGPRLIAWDGSKMIAVNTSTGGVDWTNNTGGGNLTSDVLASGNGLVYVSSTGLSAVDAKTGTLKFHTPSPNNQQTRSLLLVDGLRVFAAETWNARLHAFDSKTGALVWSQNFTGQPVQGTAAANGFVYAITASQSGGGCSGTQALLKIRETDGAILASTNTGTALGCPPPVVAGGRVFVATSAGLQAFDAGNLAHLWTTPKVGGRLATDGVSIFTVVGENTVPNTDNPQLVRIDASNGAIVANKRDDAGFTPVLANGVVYSGPCAFRATDLALLFSPTGFTRGDTCGGEVVEANGVLFVPAAPDSQGRPTQSQMWGI